VIKEVQPGAFNAIVKLSFADQVISGTISMNAIKEPEPEAGKEVTAVIKATSVMFGADESYRISGQYTDYLKTAESDIDDRCPILFYRLGSSEEAMTVV